MEQLLRSEEILAVDGFNLEGPVVYVPVRHHSPACAYHLKRAIEAYGPDCILIEGPQNAQGMIPVLSHQETKTPIALYYYYRDRRGLVNKEKSDYRCYYPFLDCSPELVALREAAKRKIPARFIDLSYGEILIGTAENKGVRAEGAKQTYNDDYLLSRGRYVSLLCEKTGLRSFEELWEKYFEIGGLFMGTCRFMNQMLAYCRLLREHTPKEEMEADGCRLREQYMAQQIVEASKEYKRILVVTGGFHTEGLQKLCREGAKKQVKLHRMSEEEQGVYPLSYSMEATDALNGYASGMQSPGFYQKVWEFLCRKEQECSSGQGHCKSQGFPRGAYQEAVLHQLVSAGRKARQKKECLSSYDVICAMSMAEGLAALRGKQEPGLFELRDAALSSFVKGELSLSTDLPLRILGELNTGHQVGSLPKDAPRPPLLDDFEQQCKKFGLEIQAALQKEVTLQLFTKKKHLSMSRFLYQMDFLETGFAKKKRGADLLNRKDQNRIRETWTYRFGGGVLSALVDVSMLGGTVEEAAKTRLAHKFSKSVSTKEAARMLAEGFLMGFWEEQADMALHVKEIIVQDGDFFSLTEGFSHLRMLYEIRDLYQAGDMATIWGMLHTCFQKIIQLLPSMAQVPDEQLSSCMESCRLLSQMAEREQFAQFAPILADAFLHLLEKKKIHPGLEGAALGLLYGYDRAYEGRIWETAAGYLTGTDEMQMKSAAFLRGLFYTAKDLVFARESFLSMVDSLIGDVPAEAFLKLLPEFRQAFGYFTPLEIDRIAAKAAALCGSGKKELLTGRAVSPLEYEYGEWLDGYVSERMQKG